MRRVSLELNGGTPSTHKVLTVARSGRDKDVTKAAIHVRFGRSRPAGYGQLRPYVEVAKSGRSIVLSTRSGHSCRSIAHDVTRSPSRIARGISNYQ